MLCALAVGLALAGTAAADPITQDPTKAPKGDYVLDKRHASLIAKIPHMGGFSKLVVHFNSLDGAFSYDPENWTSTKVTITVDPKSVDSNVPGFNDEIAGPKYFDAARYPTMTFVSTSAAGEGGHGVVNGDLTFLGKTKPVVFDVTFNGVGPGLMGFGTRMGFSGVGKIKRSDYGLKVMFAGDDVDLQFEVEFVKR